VRALNVETKEWRNLAPAPYTCYAHHMVYIPPLNGILMFGGRENEVKVNKFAAIYYPLVDKWQFLNHWKAPAPGFVYSSVIWCNTFERLLICGGTSDGFGDERSQCWAVDITSKKTTDTDNEPIPIWYELPSLLSPNQGMAIVIAQ
jgi:hypothetical protein